MNNKKLFKRALVLFASILMAVSCSSNSNPNDNNDSNNNNNTTTKNDLAVDLDTTTGKFKKIDETTAFFKVKKDGSGVSSANTKVDLVLTGTDKDKVSSISIKSITGLNATEAGKAKDGGLSSSLEGTALDFSKQTFTGGMILATKHDSQADTFTLTVQALLATEAAKVSSFDTATNGGVVEVVIVLNPTDSDKYNAKEITIYIGVVSSAS